MSKMKELTFLSYLSLIGYLLIAYSVGYWLSYLVGFWLLKAEPRRSSAFLPLGDQAAGTRHLLLY